MAARPVEKDAQIENETQSEPKAKKSRSENRISNIATMDNGTMVEVFKYMNYWQLARRSLVSKRFCYLIRTHRHSLALLEVCEIKMNNVPEFHYNHYNFSIHLDYSWISPEAYNKWVIQNHYSKHIPLEDQVTGEENAQNELKIYFLHAVAIYKDPFRDPNRCRKDKIEIFSAMAKPNHENWPVFQHFARLLTDPFVYIRSVGLTPQNDVLNLLAGTINSDHSRLQCEKLKFHLDGNVRKFLDWIKNHVLCKVFQICNDDDFSWEEDSPSYYEELLDFFFTGARCTSKITSSEWAIPELFVEFVQKFMNLKNGDECQVVESVRISECWQTLNALKNNYAKFIVKEYKDKNGFENVFEFVNDNIGKKLCIAYTKKFNQH
ncbi:hypothetical protein Ddc_16611 [Ditylenchus destructor]|nr:hypothetical protein Ddc_16611 [Ditylenchus destructor]